MLNKRKELRTEFLTMRTEVCWMPEMCSSCLEVAGASAAQIGVRNRGGGLMKAKCTNAACLMSQPERKVRRRRLGYARRGAS